MHPDNLQTKPPEETETPQKKPLKVSKGEKKEKTTVDTILNWFRDAVENKRPLRAIDWNDAALKLNILVEDIDDMIATLDGKMADEEMRLLGEDNTAAKSKKMSRQVVDYAQYLKFKAKRVRVEEFIRLAKKRGDLETRQASNFT